MSLLQIRTRLDTLETVQAELTGSVDQNVGDTSALLNALNLKALINNLIFTGTVSGITKGMVDLANADNTRDLANINSSTKCFKFKSTT